MARKEGLIGRKVGMTQIFGDDGNHIPVTIVQAGPCTVIGHRTQEQHGYDARSLRGVLKEGRISINGIVVRRAERYVGPDDTVALDGDPV